MSDNEKLSSFSSSWAASGDTMSSASSMGVPGLASSDGTSSASSVASSYNSHDSNGNDGNVVGLVQAPIAAPPAAAAAAAVLEGPPKKKKTKKRSAPRQQHQLPMFLTKTYHMINRCDEEIAAWSAVGDSFVIKNLESFASTILPQYFKHSNFSSFARQLNFYGFRKLKAEPICLADADDKTSNYVSFYHQDFQRDRPDLLQRIKRATKAEQQTKEENESLRAEIAQIRDTIAHVQAENDRKIADVTQNFNQRFATLRAEHQSLLNSVRQHLDPNAPIPVNGINPPPYPGGQLMQSLSQVAGMHLRNSPSIIRPTYSPTEGTQRIPMPQIAGAGVKHSIDGNYVAQQGSNKIPRL